MHLPHRRGAAALIALAVGLTMAVATPAAAKERGTPAAPNFIDATVHDPDMITVDGVHYVFGSHLAAASSDDLIQWTQIAGDGVTADNPLFDNAPVELSEALEWAQTDTLWAPDVIQLADGKFYMYYNACKGDSPRSAMGIAVADEVTGPYVDLGLILKSGMWGEPSEDGTIYDATVHPNVVDPDVFFDADGKLWMVYGSYSGGIFMLELDPATGFPLPDQGYGKHLMGGNHARIEGAHISYDADAGYYYMYFTFGGLDATGGYNIRVARATEPDGPYYDANGVDMATVKADPSLPLFDDASIEPYGVKLMGNYQFTRLVGDPGTGPGVGQVSPGGVTSWQDPDTGQRFMVMHSRFPGAGDMHALRTSEYYINAAGWPVIAPLRYGGQNTKTIKRADVDGTYQWINHGHGITTEIATPIEVTLTTNGKVTGALSGKWRLEGHNRVVIDAGGMQYKGVASRQWDTQTETWVVTLTGLSKQGVAVWGVHIETVCAKDAVKRVAADLSVPATAISDIDLPTVGTQNTSISWTSSNPSALSASGEVTRPEAGSPDAVVTLTAKIKNGSATKTVQFTVTVTAKPAGALVASYSFEGDLADASGQLTGTPSGALIGAQGGNVGFSAGVAGQAVTFDGQTGVRLPDGLVSGDRWAAAFWVKPTTKTMYTTTFFAASSSTSWVSVLPLGHGGVGGNSMVWAGSTWYDANLGTELPAGEWSHVALSVDEGDLTVWVDGELAFEGTGFPDVLTSTSNVFSLGVNWWDTPFVGSMDELRIWSRPITSAEVEELVS